MGIAAPALDALLPMVRKAARPPSRERDLHDALDFTTSLRIRHAARRMVQGVVAENLLSLDEISNFERGRLNDAFAVVQTLHRVLAQRYR